MKIFILAAGDAKRWDGEIKQLKEVNGESVLQRTVNMIERYGDVTPKFRRGNYHILTHSKEIIEKFNRCEVPAQGSKLLLDVLWSMPMWKFEGEVCFLMGDTIFTEKAFQKIMEPNNKSFQFYGSADEHFAFRFTSEMYNKVKSVCTQITGTAKAGTTWQLYRKLVGIPIDKDWTDRWFRTLILDKTDDIDYPEDYAKKIETGYFDDGFDYEKSH